MLSAYHGFLWKTYMIVDPEAPWHFAMGLFDRQSLTADAAERQHMAETRAETKSRKEQNRGHQRLNAMIKIAILSAISVIVMQFEFPLWFAPAFYKLDLSEVVILIGTFALGPAAGIVMELLKDLLHIVIFSSTTANVGELANFVMGCALVVPAGILYKQHRTRKTAAIGLAVGTVVLAAAASVINYFVMIPMYSELYHLPLETIISMGNAVNSHIHDLWGLILLAVVPFNLFKGVLCSIITFLLYKRLSVILKG